MDKQKIVSTDKLPEELGNLMASQFEFVNTGETKIMEKAWQLTPVLLPGEFYG